jgi:hypothetical protein
MFSAPGCRPRKCKHCRESFSPERFGQIVHLTCAEPFAVAVREKEERKKAKIEKANDRAKREAFKRIPELLELTQRDFNAWIRARDKAIGAFCISCSRRLDWSGNAVDAGHYRSVGSASHLRFDERNCHAQCKHCNQWKSGNVVDYRIGLIRRIGLEAVEALEASNEVHKWTKDELRAIRDKYRALAKELKKGQE